MENLNKETETIKLFWNIAFTKAFCPLQNKKQKNWQQTNNLSTMIERKIFGFHSQHLSYILENIKWSNTHITGIPEGIVAKSYL